MGLQLETVRLFVKAGPVTNSYILRAPRSNKMKIGERGLSESLRKKYFSDNCTTSTFVLNKFIPF